jgi:protocatechuate 3,4-dioxygenase beta subunit
VLTGFGTGMLLPTLLTWAMNRLTFAQRGRAAGRDRCARRRGAGDGGADGAGLTTAQVVHSRHTESDGMVRSPTFPTDLERSVTTEHHHEHDLGLQHDMTVLLGRRRLLGLLAGAGLATVAACAPGGGGPGGGGGAVAAGSAGEIPQETAGPYPGDGSNGPNVLTESGIVRSDITSSFGSSSGTAAGVPLTIQLTVTDVAGAAMAGAAVYVWHCDQSGRYSLYDVADQNYLRGVQVTDASGTVSFSSIFPAAYSGRWPHIHFEVYKAIADATASSNAITTSQVALPQAVCDTVYATAGYSASVSNMKQTTLANDNVFSDDGGVKQLATMTGTVASGLTAALTVPVA